MNGKKTLKKHLVGRTIVKVEWLSPKRTEKYLGGQINLVRFI
jgi:hypothetical protein